METEAGLYGSVSKKGRKTDPTFSPIGQVMRINDANPIRWDVKRHVVMSINHPDQQISAKVSFLDRNILAAVYGDAQKTPQKLTPTDEQGSGSDK